MNCGSVGGLRVPPRWGLRGRAGDSGLAGVCALHPFTTTTPRHDFSVAMLLLWGG